MALNPIGPALNVVTAPARLGLRIAGGLAGRVIGGGRRKPPAKPLDDVTIARKVESQIFRGSGAAKGKVDVNVADGVVWLRGEVKTPDLIRRLEERTRQIPEVREVENLLHLPKTPAPSRTDTPPRQRKTRRTAARPAARKLVDTSVGNEASPPEMAEPTPRETAKRGEGRRPAPLGSTPAEPAHEADGPDTAELDKDPAYQPRDPGLSGLKGG